jgi:hypothetical protein
MRRSTSYTTLMENKSQDFESQFSELNAEWFALRDSMFKDAHGFRAGLENAYGMRISFFEKLILLASGTFALSLTFLSSIHGHATTGQPLVGIRYLESAWVLMLVSILFSWVHNLIRATELETLFNSIVKGVTIGRFSAMQNVTKRMANLSQAHDRNRAGFDAMASQAQQSVSDAQSTFTALENNYKRLSRKGRYAGAVGLLALVFAFTLLLIFALKNAALL